MADTGFESEEGGTMPRIVRTEGVLGGDPRIEGRRIGVFHVYQRYVDGGEAPETIAESYEISVAAVHAALAYAFANPEEMRAIEARNREAFEAVPSNRVVPDDTT